MTQKMILLLLVGGIVVLGYKSWKMHLVTMANRTELNLDDDSEAGWFLLLLQLLESLTSAAKDSF
jgi:hypothetical protein